MSLKIVALGLSALAAASCSSNPARSTSSTAPSTSSPAQSTLSPVATASSHVTPDRSFLKAGYEARVVNGEVFYCRREEITGSQFKRTVCLNEAQVREEQRKSQAARDSMMRQRPYAPCTPMPQCAS